MGYPGYQVSVLNVPFTYPPSQVNGHLVTGMLTPGPDSAFTYPLHLKQQLVDRFGQYTPEPTGHENDKALLVERVRASTNQQRDIALFLLQERPWDFCAMVFTGSDRLQHFLWADMDSSHPFHDTDSAGRFGKALFDHYQTLDHTLADILQILPLETMVIIMSDHGFNGCARKFYVNSWLQQQGLLSLADSYRWRASLHTLLSQLGQVQWLRRIKQTMLPSRGNPTRWRTKTLAGMIDWTQTRAFFGQDGGLRVNVEGREPKGIVAPGSQYEAVRHELRDTLMKVQDPHSGNPALSQIYFREELYHGPFVERAPDLILEPQRSNSNAACNLILSSALLPGRQLIFDSSAPYSGNHDLDGLLCVWGPGVKAGSEIDGAHIMDVAPTVLAVMGLPVPVEMDGRVLSDIFLADLAPQITPLESVPLKRSGQPGDSFDHDERLAVESRLRDLGYLD
jgi:predicted AlkP superfamily phosphohydrolase/phosphomutase